MSAQWWLLGFLERVRDVAVTGDPTGGLRDRLGVGPVPKPPVETWKVTLERTRPDGVREVTVIEAIEVDPDDNGLTYMDMDQPFRDTAPYGVVRGVEPDGPPYYGLVIAGRLRANTDGHTHTITVSGAES